MPAMNSVEVVVVMVYANRISLVELVSEKSHHRLVPGIAYQSRAGEGWTEQGCRKERSVCGLNNNGPTEREEEQINTANT
jgi:hypothetical protein